MHAVSSCRRCPIPNQNSARRIPAQPSFAFVEGRYPTEVEYNAERGGEFNVATATTPVANFADAATSWTASSTAAFAWVNVAKADLTIQIINSSGAPVNSGGDAYAYDAFIPIRTEQQKPLAATISTNNNTCGITGKARVSGRGAMVVLKTSVTEAFTLWSSAFDRSAPDVTLPACAPPCDDPMTDIVEECGAAPGQTGTIRQTSGGSSSESGGQITCWFADTYVSYDGVDFPRNNGHGVYAA